jgi:transposase-like protein
MNRTPSVSEIEGVVKKYRGNIAAIARHFDVSRGTIYNRARESKKLKTALHDRSEEKKDNIESKLEKLAMEGNITALIFLAKTQLRDRGYVERQEHTGADSGPILYEVKLPDAD